MKTQAILVKIIASLLALQSSNSFASDLYCTGRQQMLSIFTDSSNEWAVNIKLEDFHRRPLFPEVDPRIVAMQFSISKQYCVQGSAVICGSVGETSYAYTIWDDLGQQIESPAFDALSSQFSLTLIPRWHVDENGDHFKAYDYEVRLIDRDTDRSYSTSGQFELFPGNECRGKI